MSKLPFRPVLLVLALPVFLGLPLQKASPSAQAPWLPILSNELAVQRPSVADTAEDRGRAERLAALIERLTPLAVKLAEPGPSDWLANYPEKGQTFAEYVASGPIRPIEARRTIEILPLGTFGATERELVRLAAEALAIWFNAPTRIGKDIPLDAVPAAARRRNPFAGNVQLLTGYILGRVLKPRLPTDAVACLCFTSSDLWPGQGWNFVFGQASLQERVGVWSIARFGDPAGSEASFRLALLRTLKLATHECGHMFSLPHCTTYECDMNGCNSLDESDRHPLALCPVCLAKLCWAIRADPAERYKKLIDFCKREGLKPEAEAYEKRLAAVGSPSEPRERKDGGRTAELPSSVPARNRR